MISLAESSTLARAATDVARDEFHGRRIHLIGIGGSGMSGLAAMLLRRGAVVTGTDAKSSVELVRLSECGARIWTLQSADTFPPDAELVVVSAAIPADHPERVAAQRLGIPIVKYAEMLGRVMAVYDGIAVSGTHGKSTTTAWLTYVLKLAGLSPSFVVGAAVEQLGGGSGVGDGPHFIAEACEYDRSFLNLRPRRTAVLNIEEDHLDYYADLAAIRAAFAEFAALLPADGLLVVNRSDARCRSLAAESPARVVTFGNDADATWRASALSLEQGAYSFDVLHEGLSRGRVKLGLSGLHNVANALAVMALAHDCGAAWDAIRQGLNDFTGARRRLELKGVVSGVCIVDDYAHHPTEIQATLLAARERFQPKRVWCVFQPHQHSRTRFLLDDFARSFDRADHVILPDIYFVRDSQRDREAVSAADLADRIVQRGGDARYVPDFHTIVGMLAGSVRAGDVVLTMGAGNIDRVADELLRRLRGNLPA